MHAVVWSHNAFSILIENFATNEQIKIYELFN